MPSFSGKRVVHEFTQTNVATPERVFPLLCPVREDEWVPGWEYRLIYSQSGVAEFGCVFTTPNLAGPGTVWVVTHYDPAAFEIHFCWVWAGMVATRLEIQLEASGAETKAHIRYVYTGLSEEGNQEVERYDEAWFGEKMHGWEMAINHYLETGKRIDGATWE